MKIILFDVGDTLEYKDQNKDVLMPGTIELLSAVQDMRDHNGDTPALALVSNFDNDRPVEEYYSLLRTLGIDTFFKPLTERVTLSSEVGVMKPDEKIFRAAIDKIHKDLSFQNVIFITENKEHTAAARKLGMMTIRLKRAWKTDGEVNSLFEMIPLIHQLNASNHDGNYWFQKGKDSFIHGKWEEAIESYNKCIEADEYKIDAWKDKIEAYNSLGKYNDVLVCYKQALKNCETAVGINPTDSHAWTFQGISLYRLGWYDRWFLISS